MKIKFLFVFISIFFFPLAISATHIVGGSLTYEQLGGSTYRVTLKLYRDCDPSVTGTFDNSITVEVYGANGAPTGKNIVINLGTVTKLNPYVDTCVTKPNVCVEEAIYTKIVNNLPPLTGGYHLFWQRCCRNYSISNVDTNPPPDVGESFYTFIPDNNILINNSSPTWVNSPPTFVCQGSPINFNHAATDADGDSLVYKFYDPYLGCDNTDVASPTCNTDAPTFPGGGVIQFNSVTWLPGFSTNNPMGGAGLTLSPIGLLDGSPPAIGQFVVGVKCEEWRNGVKIGEILRDFQFNVVNCPPLAVPDFTSAGQCSGTAVSFTNTTVPTANNYHWNFGNTNTAADTSNLTNPSYTYPTLGTYTVMMIANKGTACADTAIRTLSVSSVTPNFTHNGPGCIGLAVNFTDASTVPAPSTITNWLWKFGDGNTSLLQNPSHSYNTSGTFTVTLVVTSSAGCKDSTTKTVTIQILPVPDFTSSGVCQGTTITFTNTTSPAANAYLWNFGNTATSADTSILTNSSYTYPDFGTYTVSLVINKGTACADTVTKTISPSTITANFTDNRPGCIGMPVTFTDSSIVSSNTTITNWDWDFDDSGTDNVQNPTHTYIAIGTYTVTLIVTTASGCKDTLERLITIQNVPVPNFTTIGACNSKTIKFTNTSTPPGTTYWWDFGITPADTSNSTHPTKLYPSVGTYTVTLVANKYTACAVTMTKTITLSSITADFTSAATGCENKSVNFTDLSTTSSNSSINNWDWNFGDLGTDIVQHPVHTYTVSGTYTVTLIVTSTAGCKDTIAYPITILNSPVANAGNDTISCTNNPAINLTGTVSNATGGKWIGSGTFTPNDSSLTPSYTPTPAAVLNGKDTLYFYTTGNGGCTSDTSRIIISFYPGPTVDVGANLSVCKDTSGVPVCAAITVATGGTWQSTGSGSFDEADSLCTFYVPSTADTATGSVIVYFVTTIGNGNCLAARDSATITFTATPTSLITSADSACANGPIPIVVNVSTGSGIWTTPDGTGTFSPNDSTLNGTYNPSAADILAGKVKLVFTSTNNGGCLSHRDTIDITINPIPTVNAGSNISVCKDTSSVPVCATFTGVTAGVWKTMGTGTFADDSSSCTSYTPGSADIAAGSVIVYIATTGNGKCSAAFDSVIVTFTPPTSSVITSNDSACSGNPFPFAVNTSTGSGIWTTSGTGTFLPSDTSLTGFYNPSSADNITGFVKLYFTSTNNGGCKSSYDTINITLIPAPTAAYSNTSVCSGSPVLFSDNTIPPGSIMNWNWNFGDPLNTTSPLQNPSYVYNAGGLYTVSLIVTSNNGCKDTATKTITVFDKPLAGFDANGVCLGDGTQFLDSTTVNGSTITQWNWTFGDANTGNTQNPLHFYSSSGSYLVTLIVQSAQGCIDTVSKTVSLLTGPKADFTIDDYTAYVNQLLNFTDQSTNSPVSWFWDFGDSSSDSTSTLKNPTHTYLVGGIYNVCLIVTDAGGCRDTVCKTEIVALPPVVPTGFTPNNDGENDIFYVYGGPFKKLNVKIYNNWGEVIFESDSQSKGWDGKRNGVDQTIGVYVWIVVGDTEDDKHYELSGDVTLIR